LKPESRKKKFCQINSSGIDKFILKAIVYFAIKKSIFLYKTTIFPTKKDVIIDFDIKDDVMQELIILPIKEKLKIHGKRLINLAKGGQFRSEDNVNNIFDFYVDLLSFSVDLKDVSIKLSQVSKARLKDMSEFLTYSQLISDVAGLGVSPIPKEHDDFIWKLLAMLGFTSKKIKSKVR
jgi:hypothetical protein